MGAFKVRLTTATSLIVGLIFSPFLVLSLSLIRTTNLLKKEASELAMAGESIRVAQEMKSSLLLHSRNILLEPTAKHQVPRADPGAQRAELETLLATMSRLVISPEEDFLLDELKSRIAAYLEPPDAPTGSGSQALAEFREHSRRAAAPVSAADRLIALNHLQMLELGRNIDRQNRRADRAAMVWLGVGLGLLLVVAFLMVQLVVRPTQSLNDVISRFSSGDGAARAEPRGMWEVQQIGARFNAMADRLEERQREQLHFLSAIAHDLRNPLNSMSMASELLASGHDGENNELAGVIFRQAKNMDRMVGDLLDMARIESGQMEIREATQNLGALIIDAVNLFRTGSDLHTIVVELPEAPLTCHCDGGRISQVLANLISNAIKYSPMGGVIRVAAAVRPGEIQISVTDNGIGISGDDLERIFKPFQRSKATKGTIPGIGLGLSTSRRIVEAHGGRLLVESQLESGSTFHVILPQSAPPKAIETRSSKPIHAE